MKTGLIFIMAVLIMNMVIACTAVPVKEPEPKHQMHLPRGAIVLETVPPEYKEEEEAIIFVFKDKCFLVMPTLVAGIYNANLSRTWCPDSPH